MDADILVSCAMEAMKNSYAPYSGYNVGAALLADSGNIYRGCNIENAAYSPSICAERSAVACAVSAGERHFEAIAVCGGRAGSIDGIFPPCGVCRQVLREFCGADFKVILAKSGGEYEIYTLGQLLPESFGPDYIEK